ncbi:hypothetical protein KJ611_03885 [Patescibacteria group bacterium]|nr:hypothetical protein [Patescibacteria group bacterium]MBU1705824.1 hypothetical protein [Patescibacteria group bacterium]
MGFSEAGWFAQGEGENQRMSLQESWQKDNSLDVEGVSDEVKYQFAQEKMNELNNAMELLAQADAADGEQLEAAMAKVTELNKQKQALETIADQYEDQFVARQRMAEFLDKVSPEPAPTPLHSPDSNQPLDLSELVRYLKASQETQNRWQEMAEKAKAGQPDFVAAREEWAGVEKQREAIYETLSEPVKKSLTEVKAESTDKIDQIVTALKGIMGEQAFESIELYA